MAFEEVMNFGIVGDLNFTIKPKELQTFFKSGGYD
jgi:hypothetical protein